MQHLWMVGKNEAPVFGCLSAKVPEILGECKERSLWFAIIPFSNCVYHVLFQRYLLLSRHQAAKLSKNVQR